MTTPDVHPMQQIFGILAQPVDVDNMFAEADTLADITENMTETELEESILTTRLVLLALEKESQHRSANVKKLSDVLGLVGL